MPAWHFKIIGQVHGVGFRYAMRSEARRLQLAGWVRNRTDGSVEAVAAGEQAALEQMAQWARRGPPASTVLEVQIRVMTVAEADDASDSFNLRSTV